MIGRANGYYSSSGQQAFNKTTKLDTFKDISRYITKEFPSRIPERHQTSLLRLRLRPRRHSHCLTSHAHPSMLKGAGYQPSLTEICMFYNFDARRPWSSTKTQNSVGGSLPGVIVARIRTLPANVGRTFLLH